VGGSHTVKGETTVAPGPVVVPEADAVVSLASQTHRHVPLAMAIERRTRTNWQLWLYVRPHLQARSLASCLVAADASGARIPSAEKTSGVKCHRGCKEGLRHFRFLAFSWLDRILLGDERR
jgi:hypothetical protein